MAERKKARKKSATASEITRAKQKKSQPQVDGKREFAAIIMFALALLTFFLVIIKGQSVWEFLHKAMYGIFGVLVFVIPVILMVIAVFLAMDKLRGSVKAKIIEASVLVVLINSVIDIFIADEALGFGENIAAAYTSGILLKSGGALGALIGTPIRLACGRAGAAVIVIIAAFVLLMFLTGTTLVGLFKAVSKPVRTIERQAEDAFEERARRAEEASKRKFNPDIPVDHIPEERNFRAENKGEKLVAAYNDYPAQDQYTEPVQEGSGEEGREKTAKFFSRKPKEEPQSVAESDSLDATELSADESAIHTAEVMGNPGEKISVATETEEFAKQVMDTEDEYEEVYNYPPLELLNENKNKLGATGEKELQATADNLVNVLKSFGVETRVVDVSRGPAVTRYELQPAIGVKISKITGLSDDIALNLATAGVRIEAPIPNKAAVGIEVPNKVTAMVGVKEILETNAFANAKSKLTVALGKDIGGNAVMTDIAKMPHGLIAGATGSGKSVCINSIIISLLYKASPDEVKLLMIDPKVVELGIYNGIPHLLVPVVTDPRKASGALGWAVQEMEKRYKLFAENDVRNLEGYNNLAEMSDDMVKMPHIVIIVDELADLMMTAPKEVEDSICRIAQKARAAGMHLIIATQRPSVDVVTGLIKANVPTRVAFAVSSQIDSRTILDVGGAEKLLGKGDMLFCPVGSNKPTRIQGCFVSDAEVERVVEFVKTGRLVEYDKSISDTIESITAAKEKGGKNETVADGEHDVMIDKAIECVIEAGQASTSLLQRRLKLGYARAARIVDEMEVMGIVGPYEGSKPRQVLITQAQWLERQAMSGNSTEETEQSTFDEE